MNERNVSENQRTEAQRVAAAVIRRESRRVRTFAIVSILLWVVAFLLIASIELPAMAKAKQTVDMLSKPGPDGQPPTAQQVVQMIGELLRGSVMVAAVALGMAMLAGMFASICTVMLALTIRRVTLRQVNEGLAQISDQLRDLKRSA